MTLASSVIRPKSSAGSKRVANAVEHIPVHECKFVSFGFQVRAFGAMLALVGRSVRKL